MKRVAIVTNWGEACGVSENSRQLHEQLSKSYQVEFVRNCPQGEGYDAVIIAYHPAVVGFTPEEVRRMQAVGVKVILLLHESCAHYHVNGPTDALGVVDAVVAHEEVVFTGDPVKFKMIRVGVPESRNLSPYMGEPLVGTCGIAFPEKRMDITVRAALKIGGRSLVLAPRHAGYDPYIMYNQLRMLGGSSLELVTDWLPHQDDVVKRLSACLCNIYFALEMEGAPGQSGSARMLVAARRPVILRRWKKTQTMDGYEDELYYVTTEHEVFVTVEHIWRAVQAEEPVKIPNRIIEEQGWRQTGQQYAELIEELTEKVVV